MYHNVNAIIEETGEYLENAFIITEDDKKNYADYLKRKEKYELSLAGIKSKYKEYGGFVWFLYNAGQVLDLGLKPDELTKLIYICTYMNYDNRLIIGDKSISKHMIQEILGVSIKEFYNFYNAVTSTGILSEDKDGCFYLNTSLFCRGHYSSANNTNIDYCRTRLYIKSIRSLYKQAKPNAHKLLSYLFQAIPFVNTSYNILCFNPLEIDLDKIKPMTMKSFCEIIGYSKDNDRRLKTKLKNLKLNQIPVFSFVDNNNGLFCYINPNVYYAGGKWDEVKVLGKF